VRITVGLLLALGLAGCGGRQLVPLLASAGIPSTPTPANAVPLEVVTRSTAVKDPFPVSGSSVVYGDFEAALGHAVSSAAVPWADVHRDRRPGGWQMLVEVTSAEAEHTGGRLVVTLAVRATLRSRTDYVYLAQTETTCREGGLVRPEKGADVLYACMSRIGRDLAGWLGAVEPEPRPPPAVAEVPNLGGAVGSSGAVAPPDSDGDGIPDSAEGGDGANSD
jgi:hypothetical protein